MDQIEKAIEAPVHKAFDRKSYLAQVKDLKKAELLHALLNEADLRYSIHCELLTERFAFRDLKNELNRVRGEAQKWKEVADKLRLAIQHLMER